jgi:hypothetical protein
MSGPYDKILDYVVGTEILDRKTPKAKEKLLSQARKSVASAFQEKKKLNIVKFSRLFIGVDQSMRLSLFSAARVGLLHRTPSCNENPCKEL